MGRRNASGNDSLIPHSFVLKLGLKIYKIYSGYWYWDVPRPRSCPKDLRETTQRIQPDSR